MTPFYTDDSVTLYHGDCLEVLASLPDCSVDSVVTDPPYGLGFMGREWDDLPPGIEFATECLRVLKPGGHMLAFGGSRTWHRLTCAVEDAGFEIRDSIAWLYGSGFPKSLDVSKAIDKRPGVGRHPEFGAMLREAMTAKGYTNTFDVAEVVTGRRTGAVANWIKYQFPEAKWWPSLRDLLDLDDDTWGPIIAEADREITGQHSSRHWTPAGSEASDATEQRDKPTTADAQRWQGWGTALKPAHEPVCVAQKPYALQDILTLIGSQLDRLESEWQAQEAAPTTRTGGAAGSPVQTVTSPSESETTTSWNIATSWKTCWVEICDLTNMSTTATTSETTTALKTLLSSLSQITVENMHPPVTSQHGWTPHVLVAENLFASVASGLRATHALSAIEPATSSTPPKHRDAAEPNYEPIVVARKPLAGTVSQNVLAYGTGALNVDACRVESDDETGRTSGRTAIWSADGDRPLIKTDSHAAGRWPSNVVLDDSQATELDRQSGNGNTHGKFIASEESISGYADSGGASRFFKVVERDFDCCLPVAEDSHTDFPTFRYEPKAPTTERPRENGTAHPTVKPLDLMRWLVRLVTPPGGTVLEPFAGSGTTAEACVVEGFKCVAVEREADYLPLIVQRLSKPIQVALEFD